MVLLRCTADPENTVSRLKKRISAVPTERDFMNHVTDIVEISRTPRANFAVSISKASSAVVGLVLANFVPSGFHFNQLELYI